MLDIDAEIKILIEKYPNLWNKIHLVSEKFIILQENNYNRKYNYGEIALCQLI